MRPITFLLFSVYSVYSVVSSSPCPAAEQSPTNILIAIAEPGYHTWETLPAFANKFWNAANGCKTTIIIGDPAAHDLPGLDKALPKADVLVLSIRRQALPKSQLQAIRNHLADGKPLLAIRTSSHGLTAVGKGPPGNPEWDSFDVDVLGAGYKTHTGHKLTATFTAAKESANHPILEGVTLPFSSGGGIYLNTGFAKTATPVLIATYPPDQVASSPDDRLPRLRSPISNGEPVAWTNTYGPNKSKIFYTSLGQEEEFASPSFQKLLQNALTWLTE